MASSKQDLIFEKGLPSDPLAERMLLGAVLGDPALMQQIADLDSSIFANHKHRLIHARMKAIHERGQQVDRIVLASELGRHRELETIDGLSGLLDLEVGIPAVPSLEGYIRIVREKYNLRRIIFQSQKMLDQALAGDHTPEEILSEGAQSWNEIESESGQNDDGGKTAEEVITTYPGGISAFLDPSLRVKGLSTGFHKLDEMTTGLHRGDVIIVAAGTGQGKTSFAMNIAQHLCLHPKQRRQVAVFSLEMSAESLITRMACAAGRVDAHKFRAGYLNKEERYRLQVATNDIVESNLRIFDRPGITAPEIRKAVRSMKKGDGLHLAIVDYIQLVGSHSKSENRNQELSVMSRQFKMLAGECDIPIILVSQLSRAGSKRSDPRPQLSDLRDSGSLEQDASLVMFIWREELLKRDREDLRGLADIIIAKQRNGPIGTVPLRFLGQFMKFENRVDDLQEEE